MGRIREKEIGGTGGAGRDGGQVEEEGEVDREGGWMGGTGGRMRERSMAVAGRRSDWGMGGC